MSLRWFEKNAVEKTAKKVIDRIMRNVDQTMKKNPGLTVEEALKIVDRQQGVFFPADKIDTKDLKSLFALIVWKGYRNITLSDPDASSEERRKYVSRIVDEYLKDQNSTTQAGYKKIVRPAAAAAGICAVILALLFLQPVSSKNPATVRHDMKNNNSSVSSSSLADLFRYHGYASDNEQKLALVNKSFYHEGDYLGDRDGYVLKSIYPKHIVILDRHNKSEFSVFLQ